MSTEQVSDAELERLQMAGAQLSEVVLKGWEAEQIAKELQQRRETDRRVIEATEAYLDNEKFDEAQRLTFRKAISEILP